MIRATFAVMGEYKPKMDQPRRLLLRLQFPTDEPMVVGVEGIDRDFLERVWKLMLSEGVESVRVHLDSE